MTALFNSVLAAAQKRQAYLDAVYELENLPVETAVDVNLYPGDAEKIAYQAVYGG